MPDLPLNAGPLRPPDQLPRKLVFLLGGLAVAMWLLALVAAYNVHSSAAHARQLAAEGVEGATIVLDLRISGRHNRARDTNAGLGLATYTVIHRIVSPQRSGPLRTDVSFALFETLEAGSRIPIRYVPTNPAIHELERGSLGQDRRLGWAGLALFGSLATALSIAAVRPQFLRPRRREPAGSA